MESQADILARLNEKMQNETRYKKIENKRFFWPIWLNTLARKKLFKIHKNSKFYKRSRWIFPLTFFAGVAILLSLNLCSLSQLPDPVLQLIRGQGEINNLLFQTTDPRIKAELLQIISSQANTKTFLDAYQQSQNQKTKLILSAKTIAQKNPQYPDIYAYLATLYWQTREIESAKNNIHKALLLDPNRAEFYIIKAEIEK